MVFSFLRSLLCENVKTADILRPKLDDRMIKQLLNSVRLLQNILICQCLAGYLPLLRMIDLLVYYKHDILLNLVQLSFDENFSSFHWSRARHVTCK